MNAIITNEENMFFGKTEIVKSCLSEGTVSVELSRRGDCSFGVHFYNLEGQHIDVIAVDAKDVGEVFHHLLYAFDGSIDISVNGKTEKERTENINSSLVEFSISNTKH